MTYRRDLDIVSGLVKYRMQTIFAYIVTSWIGMISTFTFCAVYLATFGLIAQRVGNVGGFTRDQIYLSLLVGELTFLFSVGQVFDPAAGLNKLVNDGGLDFLLIRPFSVRTQIAIQYSNLFNSLQNGIVMGTGIALLINWHTMSFSIRRDIYAALLWVSGYFVYRFIVFCLTYPVFIYGDASDSIGFAWTMFYNFYTPFEALPGFIKFSSFVLLPSFLMTGGVVMVLLGRPGYMHIVWPGLLVGAISFVWYKILWRKALKRYTSASS